MTSMPRVAAEPPGRGHLVVRHAIAELAVFELSDKNYRDVSADDQRLLGAARALR